jgi:hypothetical protein
MPKNLLNAALGGALLLVVSIGSPSTGGSQTSFNVVSGAHVDPANFVAAVDNPWFPLKPGTTLTYRGKKDGRLANRIVTITSKTKVIDGVNCVVLDDYLTLAGMPHERTVGYYAQDKDGNVWYFGEDTMVLSKKGKVVKTEGWRAGVDGALPSFYMEAKPALGHTFSHKFTKSNFEVIDLSRPVKVPFGSYPDAVVTKEWSPEEPDVVFHKYYVRGLGEVRDVAVKGEDEELVLTRFSQ